MESILKAMADYFRFQQKLDSMQNRNSRDVKPGEYIEFALLISALKDSCKLNNVEFPTHMLRVTG